MLTRLVDVFWRIGWARAHNNLHEISSPVLAKPPEDLPAAKRVALARNGVAGVEPQRVSSFSGAAFSERHEGAFAHASLVAPSVNR